MALICSYCGSTCSQRDEANGRCGSCACFFTGNEEVVAESVEPKTSVAEEVEVVSPFALPESELPDVKDSPVQFDPTAVELTSPPPELANSEGLIQPRKLSPQFRRRVEKTWESTFSGAGHNAQSTLSSHTPSAETKSESPTISIATRKISRAKDGQRGGASEDDYELNEVIGEGSMGRVWSARQTSLDRDVAVKVPMAELTGAGSVGESQFISEVVVTGQLEHPNIVPIYELGRDASGVPFYSMKHVKGRPWNEFIEQRSEQENLEILMKVCDAIAFAHDRNFLHRDIKPHNVMVGEFGEVSVMDWGIAVAITKDPTQPWASIATGPAGTPAYMAPEMAAHNPSELGVVSDVYLLGAVLYEIVTGTPPHPRTGDTGEALLAAAANEIIPTTRSGELVDIARRAMATKLDDRYQSVKELQDAIREYQSHSESIKLSESADHHFSRAIEDKNSDEFARARFAFEEALKLWDGNTAAQHGIRVATIAHAENALAQENYELGISILEAENPEHRELLNKLEAHRAARNRLAWFSKIAATTALLAVLGVVGITLYANGELKQSEADLRISADALKQERDKAVDRELDAKNAKARAETSRDAAFKAQRKARQLEGLARLEKRRAEEAPYGSEIGLAAESIRRKLKDKAETILNNLDPKQVDANPVLSKLSHLEWGLLKHAWTPSAVKSVLENEAIESVASSRDGSVVAAATDRGTILLYLGPGGVDLAVQPKSLSFGDKINAIAISDDGRFLAAAGIQSVGSDAQSEDADFSVRVWQIGNDASISSLPSLQGHKSEVLSVAFCDDGSRIVTSAADRTAVVWDRAAGTRLSVMADHLDEKVWCARFSANDRDRVVTACEDGRVRVWRVSDAEKLYDFRGHNGAVYAAAFSSDGDWVISGGYDRRLLRWKLDADQSDAVAGGLNLLKQRLQGDVDSRRGQSSVEDEIGPPADRHTASIRSIAVGELQGRPSILTGGNDNTIRVWSSDGNAWSLTKVLSGHGRWVRSCVFSASGATVLSGAYDGLKLWDWQDYSMPRDLVPDPEVRLSRQPSERGLPSALKSIYSRDGRWVATVYANGTVEVWDLKNPDRANGTMLVEGHAMLAATGEIFDQGKQLMTSAGDNTTRIWNVERGTHVQKLTGTGYRGTAAVSWRADQETAVVITGSDDRMIPARLWNIKKDGDPISVPLLADYAEARLKDMIGRRHAGTANGGDAAEVLLATVRRDQAGQIRRRIPDVTAIAFSTDGKQFVIGDSSGQCFLYKFDADPLMPRQVVSFHAHGAAVQCAAYLPDGQSLITADIDGEVVMWDSRDGKNKYKLPWSGPVTAVDLSADGKQLLIGHAPFEGRDFSVVESYRLEGDRMIGEATFELQDPLQNRDWRASPPTVRSVKFDGSGDRAFISLFFPAKQVSGSTAAANPTASSRYRAGYLIQNGKRFDFDEIRSAKLGEISAAVMLGDQSQRRQLLVVGGKGARLLSASDGQQRVFSQLDKSFRPAAKIVTADFAYDPINHVSNRLVIGDSEGNVRVWELDGDQWSETSNAATHLAGHHSQAIVSTQFDPTNPDRMITADKGGVWKLWQFNGQWVTIAQQVPAAGSVESLHVAMFAPSGDQVLIGKEAGAQIWRVDEQGSPRRVLEDWNPGLVRSAIFSEDGSWVVTSDGDRILSFWDSQGNAIGAMDEEDASGTTAFALTYDRRRLITAQGKDIRMWDTSPILERIATPSSALGVEREIEGQDNKLVKELFTLNKKLFRLDSDSKINEETEVTSISISPDGRHLLSSGMNGKTTIWQGETVAPITLSFSNNQFSIQRDGQFKNIGEFAFLSDPGRIAKFGGVELTVTLEGEELAGEELSFQPHTNAVGASIFQMVEQGQVVFYHRAHHQDKGTRIGVLQPNSTKRDRRITLADHANAMHVQALLGTLSYRVIPSGAGTNATEPSKDAESEEMSVVSRSIRVRVSGVQYDRATEIPSSNPDQERSPYPDSFTERIVVDVEPEDATEIPAITEIASRRS